MTRRLANTGLLVIIAGLAAIALAVAVVPAVNGWQPITIDRNSMQDVLPAGSLAYIEERETYTVGDVVTYRQSGNVITHQIVALLPNPANRELDGLWLQTKGTSNDADDPYQVNRDQVLGAVVASTPMAGLALRWLGHWQVQAFLALTAIGLWWLSSEPSRTQRRLNRLFPARAPQTAPRPIGEDR